MKNYQLNILKNLIREEIKLQKKNRFFLYEDVTSADAAAMGNLGTPVILKIDIPPKTNKMTITIGEVKGYINLNIINFPDWAKFSPLKSEIQNKVNQIKIIYDIGIEHIPQYSNEQEKTYNANAIFNEMNFNLTSDEKTKTINLQFSWKNKETPEYYDPRIHPDKRIYDYIEVVTPKEMKIVQMNK